MTRRIPATIGQQGEVRLPPDVLRALGVGPLDQVDLLVVDNEVRIVAPDHTSQASVSEERAQRAAQRRAALAQISSAFAHESVEEAENAVAAALAEVRSEHRGGRP